MKSNKRHLIYPLTCQQIFLVKPAPCLVRRCQNFELSQ